MHKTRQTGFFRIKVILLLLLGALLFGTFEWGLSRTNTTEFCTSCHSMQWNLNEWRDSEHGKNGAGVAASCADCHVPKSFWPKMAAKIMAAKDVYHEILGTIDNEEKFEQQRWVMANRVWDKMIATDSRECRSCHAYDDMDLSAQDRSARKKHPRAVKDGETCIECHKGIAHEEPMEP